jgi:hypothetical protein
MSDNLDLRLNASMRHRSSMFSQRQELFLSPALTTIDLGVGLATADDKMGIDLLVKNVNNAISEDFGSPSADPRFGPAAYLAAVTRSRSVMLTARFKY